MTRVLLHAFSTFKLGGPQARFVQLANAFGARYRHVIAAMDDCFDAGERLEPAVHWAPLRLPNRRGGALANRADFRRALAAQAPDMLFSYNWGAIEWAAGNWPKRVPQVHVEDGFGPEEAQGQLPRRVWTRRVLLGLTRTPVVVASGNLERIARSVWRLPARCVQFVPNGVDLSHVPSAAAPAQDGVLTIGTVAGLRPEKNVARLVRAFAAVRARMPVRLVIVGDGPERAALQSLVAELGLGDDVEFAGYLARPLERLSQFDLFALSSDTEQLPISMLEAMACGVPVVATRVGDVPDILPSGAGVLAEPSDAAFASALWEALEARASWPAWCAAGRAQVDRHYRLDRMLERWEALFDGRIEAVFTGAAR